MLYYRNDGMHILMKFGVEGAHGSGDRKLTPKTYTGVESVTIT